MKHHIYVFGAGASKASANMPIGKDLVWKYHSDCPTFVPLNDNGKPNLEEENIEFQELAKFYDLVAPIYPEYSDLPNKHRNRGLEIVSCDQIPKRHYIDEILEEMNRRKNYEGVELIRRLIFEHITEITKDKWNEDSLYKRFVDKVLLAHFEDQYTFISFNFDVLLSGAAYEKNIFFDYRLEFDSIDPKIKKYYLAQKTFKLIKLNGSLDWGICPSCGRIHLYFPPLSKNFFDEQKCSGNCSNTIQPLIVIPHESHKLESLWELASRELKSADIITIIGYSFPEYDKAVRDLFARALRPDVKIEVVDLCKDDGIRKIICKYKKMFPKIRLNPEDIFLNGFKGYMDKRM